MAGRRASLRAKEFVWQPGLGTSGAEAPEDFAEPMSWLQATTHKDSRFSHSAHSLCGEHARAICYPFFRSLKSSRTLSIRSRYTEASPYGRKCE